MTAFSMHAWRLDVIVRDRARPDTTSAIAANVNTASWPTAGLAIHVAGARAKTTTDATIVSWPTLTTPRAAPR